MEKFMVRKIILLEDGIRDYIRYCLKERKLSDNTIKSYQIVLKKFRKFVLSRQQSEELAGITKEMIRAYLEHLNETGKSSTARHHINVVQGFFSYLEENEIIEDTPFRKMHIRIREPKRLPDALNIDEVNRILKAVYSSPDPVTGLDEQRAEMIHWRDCVIIEFLFSTGMRVQELCGLRFSDLDCRSGVIDVIGKGDKQRHCYITDDRVLDVYFRYLTCRKCYAPRNDHIFITRFEKTLSTQCVRDLVNKYTAMAGISKKVTPHTFRHTFASMLVEEGVDLSHIQKYMGHSTISTTQIYLHISDQNARRVLMDKHPRSQIDTGRYLRQP